MQNLSQADGAKLSGVLSKWQTAIQIAFNIDTVMPTNQHIVFTIQAVYTALSKKLEALEEKIAELDAKLDECMSDADTEYTVDSEYESASEGEASEEEEPTRYVIIVDDNGRAFTSE